MFVDFNILNQLGSPSINSNTFANRPAAGQIGRLFVSTDTFEIYRDNGTTWDLIGGPGSSTITGTGTATQVAYFTSSQSIGSSSNLFWDATNNRLGLGTQTPGARLDIHSAADVGLQLNGTGASPSILQEFLSAGVAEYDLGYVWNADVNYQRFRINDVSGAKEVLTIDKQSRFVGINYQYSSLVDQPAYTFDVEGSGRFTNSAYFVSSGSGQVGINTLAPTATALMQVDKTDGYGLHLNYTTNAGSGSTATALWSLNTTNGSGYSAIIEEKTPNTTAGQYPLLIKHSLSAGTAGVGIGTGIHFQLPDNAGTFRTTQLTIETTDAAAATYTSRYRFMAQVSGTSTALAYLTSTGLGINGIPTRALELFTNTSTQTAALVLNNAATTPKGYLGTYTNNLYITQGGTFNTSWAADGTNAISAIILGANNNSSTILFQTTNANNSTPLTRMYISETGNVGIGTTGPAAKLSVANAAVGTAAIFTNTNDSDLFINFATNLTSLFNTAGSAALAFGTANTERMRITSGGLVGIGTSNPTSRFAVRGTNSNSQIEFDNFGSGVNYILSYDIVASAYRDIVLITNSSNNTLYAATSGNVGIGTTSPTYKLQVTEGGISFGGADKSLLKLVSGTTTELNIIQRNVSGFIGSILSSSDALSFETSATERMRITSGGNVLIGATTDIGARLSVKGGTIDFNGDTRYGVSRIYNSSTGDMFGLEQVSAVQTGSNAATRLFTSATGSADLVLGKYTNATSFTSFLTLSNAGNALFAGSIKTAAPTTGTAADWKLGSRVAATVVVNTTEYIEIDIGGTLYKLATVT